MTMKNAKGKTLDEKGRCCGRKPLVYKRPPLRFCFRCERAYALEENEQIPNWAWRQLPNGEWKCQTNRMFDAAGKGKDEPARA